MSGHSGGGKRKTRRVWAALVAGIAAAALIGWALFEWGPRFGEADDEYTRVGVRVIVLSDDDGSRAAQVEGEEVERAVEIANRIYADARIRFEFDPATDMSSMHRTVLNQMVGVRAEGWAQAERIGNEIAEQAPDQVTVFYRYGPYVTATQQAFSSAKYDFIVMPSPRVHRHCGEPRSDALAHELGHYLGLLHTFRRKYDTVADAIRAAHEQELEGRHFDGDRLEDTPPDPYVEELGCDPPDTLTLGEVSYPLPVGNVMSYYTGRRELTPEQIRVVRWALDRRLRSGMSLHPRHGPADPIEVENLEFETQGPCRAKTQQMSDFPEGSWSGGAQLVIRGTGECRVIVRLPVERAGNYRVELWATQARDYGVVEVELEGGPAARSFDLYSPRVLPSGPLDLGTLGLDAGSHSLAFHLPEGQALAGFDAVSLIPVDG